MDGLTPDAIALFDASVTPALLMAPEGAIVRVNPALAQLLGCDVASIREPVWVESSDAERVIDGLAHAERLSNLARSVRGHAGDIPVLVTASRHGQHLLVQLQDQRITRLVPMSDPVGRRRSTGSRATAQRARSCCSI